MLLFKAFIDILFCYLNISTKDQYIVSLKMIKSSWIRLLRWGIDLDLLFNYQNNFVYWSFQNLILIVAVWFPNPKLDTSDNTIIIRHDLLNYCHWPFISFTASLQENHITNFKISLLVIPFLSELELTQKFLFPPCPKLICYVLDSSPPPLTENVWPFKNSRWW